MLYHVCLSSLADHACNAVVSAGLQQLGKNFRSQKHLGLSRVTSACPQWDLGRGRSKNNWRTSPLYSLPEVFEYPSPLFFFFPNYIVIWIPTFDVKLGSTVLVRKVLFYHLCCYRGLFAWNEMNTQISIFIYLAQRTSLLIVALPGFCEQITWILALILPARKRCHQNQWFTVLLLATNVDLLDQVFFHIHLDIISTVGLEVNDAVTV